VSRRGGGLGHEPLRTRPEGVLDKIVPLTSHVAFPLKARMPERLNA